MMSKLNNHSGLITDYDLKVFKELMVVYFIVKLPVNYDV